jgi:hypothetical protein
MSSHCSCVSIASRPVGSEKQSRTLLHWVSFLCPCRRPSDEQVGLVQANLIKFSLQLPFRPSPSITNLRGYFIALYSISATNQSGDGLVDQQPLTLGMRHVVREYNPVGSVFFTRVQKLFSRNLSLGHLDRMSSHFRKALRRLGYRTVVLETHRGVIS